MVEDPTLADALAPSVVQAVSTAVLTVITAAYAYLTFRVVGETRRQVEELRRERKRPYVFDIVFDGIENIEAQLDDRRPAGRDGSGSDPLGLDLPSPPPAFERPPDHVWSDLVRDRPELEGAYDSVVESHRRYDEAWNGLLGDVEAVFVTAPELYAYKVGGDLSDDERHELAYQNVFHRTHDPTDEELADSEAEILAEFERNPSREEFLDRFVAETGFDRETAGRAFRWLARNDGKPAWFLGKVLDGDARRREIARGVLTGEDGEFAGMAEEWQRAVHDAYTELFPERTEKTGSRLEAYRDAAADLESALADAKEAYFEEYNVSRTELVRKRAEAE